MKTINEPLLLLLTGTRLPLAGNQATKGSVCPGLRNILFTSS